MPAQPLLLPTDWSALSWSAALLLAAAAAGFVAYIVLFATARRVAARTRGSADDTLIAAIHRPAALVFPVFAVHLALDAVGLDPAALVLVERIIALLLIGGVGWALMAAIGAAGQVLARRSARSGDPLHARLMDTKIRVLTRTAAIVIGTVTVSAMLMTFPMVRQLGASILASAGIAGLIAGFAAGPVLKNLIAGVQLALTEPIVIGDQVAIDGQPGVIEEVRASYVVIRYWDERRLIVPLSYFIENRFENWTYKGAQLLAAVTMSADFSTPIPELRATLKQALDASGLWDGRAWAVEVSNATKDFIEFRATATATDPENQRVLKNLIRERLVAFLQGLRRAAPASAPVATPDAALRPFPPTSRP